MTIKSSYETSTNVPGELTLRVSGVGAGAADCTSVKGATLIDQTATGLYTVTLPRAYAVLVNVTGMVMSSTVANWTVRLRSSTVATDGKFLIAVLSAADNAATAPTATDLTTAETLMLNVVLQDTAAKPAAR